MISLFVLDAARAELNRLNITKTKCYNFVVEYDEESDNSALTINGKAIASKFLLVCVYHQYTFHI